MDCKSYIDFEEDNVVVAETDTCCRFAHRDYCLDSLLSLNSRCLTVHLIVTIPLIIPIALIASIALLIIVVIALLWRVTLL